MSWRTPLAGLLVMLVSSHIGAAQKVTRPPSVQLRPRAPPPPPPGPLAHPKAKIRVLRIGPEPPNPTHDHLVQRMNELGVEWIEIPVLPGNVSNPYLGSPSISRAWAKAVASGDIPEVVWEQRGRLTAAQRVQVDLEYVTIPSAFGINSNVYLCKSAYAYAAAKQAMLAFVDPVDAASQQSLRDLFVKAAVSILTGDVAGLVKLSSSQSEYQRKVHQEQFGRAPGTYTGVSGATPLIVWGNNRFAVVTGLIHWANTTSVAGLDAVSFWVQDKVVTRGGAAPAAPWKLLTMTIDPANTREFYGPYIARERLPYQLVPWLQQNLAAYTNNTTTAAAAGAMAAASRPTLVRAPNATHADWVWDRQQPAAATIAVATASRTEVTRASSTNVTQTGRVQPFAQMVEFHYGSWSQVFPVLSQVRSVPAPLGRTGGLWTARVWTVYRDGSVTISQGTDFVQ